MESIVFNEDCMTVMARYADKYFDLAIVDPPYGSDSDAIKTHTSNSINKAAKRTVYEPFDNTPPKPEYFTELKRVSKNQIVWGGNWFGLIGGYLCWNKNGTAFGEAELAYCSMFNSVRIYEYTWNGMLQGNMKDKEVRIHPTQKPVQLYRYCLQEFGGAGFKILDTHVGSGSSRIACDREGFDFIGCEISETHYMRQEKRFANYKSQLKLF